MLQLNEVAKSSFKHTESDEPAPKQGTTNDQQPNQGNADDQKSGWFGGILDKLSIRPKNQMKLPDDKNPSVSAVFQGLKFSKKKFFFVFSSVSSLNVRTALLTFHRSSLLQIVWDKEKKQWVNLDGDSDAQNQIKPPPRAFDLGGSVQSNALGQDAPNSLVQNLGPTSLPPSTNNNKYKLQKGKCKWSHYNPNMGQIYKSRKTQ